MTIVNPDPILGAKWILLTQGKLALSQRKFALIDEEDYEHVIKYSWHSHGGGYACAWIRLDGKEFSTVLMHRFIYGTVPDSMDIDHINGDKLDNRKSNLRACLHCENSRNQIRKKLGSSKYKGVDYHKSTKKWRARIKKDYKDIHLGLFDSELEASRVYDAAALELFGEFANTNSPLVLDIDISWRYK